MHDAAVKKALRRLNSARQQLEDVKAAGDHEAFSDAWYLFLVSAKAVYVMLEQGAKASPASLQWFAGKKGERKADPLLQYLFQARNDDEHGLGDVTKEQPGFIGIGKVAPGFSNRMRISLSTDAAGRPTIHELESLDGLPVLIESAPRRSVLVPVKNRGVTYDPPTQHLGNAIADASPYGVGKLAVEYLERVVAEAEALVP